MRWTVSASALSSLAASAAAHANFAAFCSAEVSRDSALLAAASAALAWLDGVSGGFAAFSFSACLARAALAA